MKRFLLILSIFLFVSFPASAGTPRKTVSKTLISTTLMDCRRYPGVEMVKLGRIKTAALKGVVRLAAATDPDARDALRLMKGIHGVTVLDYEDCSGADKDRISRRLERALAGSETLMEASDGGEKMRIYGIVDEQGAEVRDFVLYTPSDCALICIFGSLSMETVARIASHD